LRIISEHEISELPDEYREYADPYLDFLENIGNVEKFAWEINKKKLAES
jgi:hypothetical protein